MKPHHHINVNREMKEDLLVWLTFLRDANVYCRPFIDFSRELQAQEVDWYTDASGVIGIGGHHDGSWFQSLWDKEFLKKHDPSIQFKELYAVTASILLWGDRFPNKRIRLFCDNKSVVGMLNNNTSGCKQCMNLIRLIVRACLSWNLRVFGKHVKTKDNYLADALSRYQMGRFWADVKKDGRSMKTQGEIMPEAIWPVDKVWLK